MVRPASGMRNALRQKPRTSCTCKAAGPDRWTKRQQGPRVVQRCNVDGIQSADGWPWALELGGSRAVVKRPNAPPWAGDGGEGILQVRRVGATRGGDTPLVSMGCGESEVSLPSVQPSIRLNGAMGSRPVATMAGGMQRGHAAGTPLPRCVVRPHTSCARSGGRFFVLDRRLDHCPDWLLGTRS